MIVGMNEVGARFKRGDMFVPEVLMSADAMQAGLEILRPELVASGVKMIGKVVLGTVKGDLHDIGKNLVGMMCEGAGFEIDRPRLQRRAGEIRRGRQRTSSPKSSACRPC